MDAIRYVETIEGDTITIKNLKKYKGSKVEIIILPYETEKYEYDDEWANEAELRIKAFDKGIIKAIGGESVIRELKRKGNTKK